MDDIVPRRYLGDAAVAPGAEALPALPAGLLVEPGSLKLDRQPSWRRA